MSSRFPFRQGLFAGIVLLICCAPARSQVIQGEDLNRILEIEVMIAWLGEPALCPYYPCARVEGKRIRVGGYLPNEALKNQALEIARAKSGLPVIDQITVLSEIIITPTQVADKQFLANVRTVLQTEFPVDYPSWRLSLLRDGVVGVEGSINSHENKLHVSERLRCVPGCVCVVNLLRVTNDAQERQPLRKPPENLAKAVPDNAQQPIPTRRMELVQSAPPAQKPLVEQNSFGSTPGTIGLPREINSVLESAPSLPEHNAVRGGAGTIAPKPSAPNLRPAPPSAAIPPNRSHEQVQWRPSRSRGQLPIPNSFRRDQTNGVRRAMYSQPSSAYHSAPAYNVQGNSNPLHRAQNAAQPNQRASLPSQKTTEAYLAQQIRRACGPTLLRLDLQLVSNHTVNIRFTSINPSEAERLARVISSMPALKQYHVNLSLQVPRR